MVRRDWFSRWNTVRALSLRLGKVTSLISLKCQNLFEPIGAYKPEVKRMALSFLKDQNKLLEE